MAKKMKPAQIVVPPNPIDGVPWECDNKDCAQTWHMARYDFDPVTADRIVSEFGDDDWETLDETAIIPSSEECWAAWNRYYKYVADTGSDPLDVLKSRVPREREVKERWKFRFTQTAAGVEVLEALHGKRQFFPNGLPRYVRTYLEATVTGHICAVKNWGELVKLLPGVKQKQWYSMVIENKVVRSEKVVQQELRAYAKSYLRGDWIPRINGRPITDLSF